MSDFANDFLAHLQGLAEQQRGAMAVLRRSLAFAPGAYVPAYPYVERFVKRESHPDSPQRLALYLVAGLYAKHAKPGPRSLASSLAYLMRQQGKDRGRGIEKRFVALLGVEADGLPHHLRQIVSLLAADGVDLDYATLLDDLSFLLNTRLDPERRDQIRQRWARDFYRTLAPIADEPSTANHDRKACHDFVC